LTFQRQGDDLLCVSSINLVDAALGTDLSGHRLEGESIPMTIPLGTQNGTSLKIDGKGTPRPHHKRNGDLYLIGDVRRLTDMTPIQRQLLEKYARFEKDRNLKKLAN